MCALVQPGPVGATATAALGGRRGLFVVLEGIDGSGKSTVSAEAAKILRSEGRDVVLTAEPSSSWLGDAVRRAHKEGVDDLAEGYLFLADRTEHTKTIKGWLGEGKIVLCDRYYASTLAYQGAALAGRMEDPVSWLWEMNRPIVLKPDLAFYLKIDPERSLRRTDGRGERSKFERLDYLREVERIYRQIANRDGFVIIDAAQPRDIVVDQVLLQIRQKI